MRKIVAVIGGLIVVVCVSLWFWERSSGGTGALSVTALDVGQGDAILIRTPHGADILIDAGPPSGHVVEKLGAHLSPSDREIELVVVSHTDADHIGGLADVAAHYRIGRVLDAGTSSSNPTYAKWLGALDDRHVERMTARAGVTVNIDGVRCSVVWPGSDADLVKASVNDTSVIVELAYGTTSFLFTGDAGAEVEARMLQRQAVHHVDVLKVAHHGSVYSSSVEFLDAVKPTFAIASVGRGNSYGHPHGIVIDRLKARGAEVLRTDEMGDVRLESDGEEVRRNN